MDWQLTQAEAEQAEAARRAAREAEAQQRETGRAQPRESEAKEAEVQQPRPVTQAATAASLATDPQRVRPESPATNWIPFVPITMAAALILSAVLIFWSFAPAK